eukprot:TRINITY_DN47711_c0_g1_i1.p1 TRINITY_DN47711_c0_g1~~TRINITY_DN47711_c0_g1_i1.p1  ORF type:complete len:291 (-),score=56.33 TRINITY_DN47711_c0_g1_i1:141-956(-)
MPALAAYAACQSACSAVWVTCYTAAGLVAGTVTGGVGAPAAALACNAACGTCMKTCAAKFLAEGAAETAATGGAMGAVNIVGGVVVAAGGWFGRAAIGKAVGSIATRFGARSAAAGAASAASTGTASGAAAATATGGFAVLPVTITVASAASVGYAAWKFYKWWREPSFPVGMRVRVAPGSVGEEVGGSSVGREGVVQGIARGYVVVVFDDDPDTLVSVSPEHLEVLGDDFASDDGDCWEDNSDDYIEEYDDEYDHESYGEEESQEEFYLQ